MKPFDFWLIFFSSFLQNNSRSFKLKSFPYSRPILCNIWIYFFYLLFIWIQVLAMSTSLKKNQTAKPREKAWKVIKTLSITSQAEEEWKSLLNRYCMWGVFGNMCTWLNVWWLWMWQKLFQAHFKAQESWGIPKIACRLQLVKWRWSNTN